MVALDSSAGLALAIDFGHRHLRVAVSDLSHSVLAETWRELDVDHSADEGLAAAADFVDQVLAEAGVDRDRVIGVAMGLPAPINRATGMVQASSILPGWVGVDAVAEASQRLRLPVVVENDANLGALAELMWGAAKGRSDIAYLKVASGIGGGTDLAAAGSPTAWAAPRARSATPCSPRVAPFAGAATAAAWRRWPRRERSPTSSA